MEAIDPRWRKSSHSGNGGNCVEVATAGTVLVRDTEDQDGTVLAFGHAAWNTFTATVKAQPDHGR